MKAAHILLFPLTREVLQALNFGMDLLIYDFWHFQFEALSFAALYLLTSSTLLKLLLSLIFLILADSLSKALLHTSQTNLCETLRLIFEASESTSASSHFVLVCAYSFLTRTCRCLRTQAQSSRYHLGEPFLSQTCLHLTLSFLFSSMLV